MPVGGSHYTCAMGDGQLPVGLLHVVPEFLLPASVWPRLQLVDQNLAFLVAFSKPAELLQEPLRATQQLYWLSES